MAKKALPAKTLASAADQEPPQPASVLQINVGWIVRHPFNARAVPRTKDEMAALVASVREVGVVLPVVLAPLPTGRAGEPLYGAIAGWGRVQAALAAGYPTVPAILFDRADDALARLSAVENEVRASMHPVDKWRALCRLAAGGRTVAEAGAILGLSAREAAKLARLGDIAEPLLDAMVEQMPQPHHLGLIANADHARQLAALKAGTVKQGKRTWVEWQTVANACRVTRIPRAWAIFDTSKSDVVFEEDLFADPKSPEAWTTTSLTVFMFEQRAAIEAYVAEHAPLVIQAEWDDDKRAPEVPKGWVPTGHVHEFPKNGPPFALLQHQRMVLALQPNGLVAVRLFSIPPPKEAGGASSAPAEPKAQRLITDAGLQMTAAMKHAAFASAVDDIRTMYDSTNAPSVLLRVLLQCLAAQNVTPGGADKRAAMDAIDAEADGTGEPTVDELMNIAIRTISAMMVFPAPKVISSGPVADKIAASIGAGRYLPRFDTREFLAECSGALLRDAVKTISLPMGQRAPKGVDALREFLVGKLPDWRPVSFQAAKEVEA